MKYELTGYQQRVLKLLGAASEDRRLVRGGRWVRSGAAYVPGNTFRVLRRLGLVEGSWRGSRWYWVSLTPIGRLVVKGIRVEDAGAVAGVGDSSAPPGRGNEEGR